VNKRAAFRKGLRALAAAWLLLISRAPSVSALEVVLKGVHTPGSIVTTTIELRDPLPDRFRKLIDDGGALHLRIQAELWESRPVWDRLVYPAIVRVFRLARAISGRDISISDSTGTVRTYPSMPSPFSLAIELGQRGRIVASARYYVRVMATAGTLAERDADDVGDVVFGRDSESTGLGALGRIIFRTAIKVSDYLQSVSAEATGRKISGSDLLKP